MLLIVRGAWREAAAPVRKYFELLVLVPVAQVIARGIKVELDHPVAGKLAGVASPMRFSATPVEHKLAPPVLGQHTDEVLRGTLNLSESEIAKLHAEGVI